MIVTFEVPGTPVAKGRPRFTSTGRSYTPEKTVAYENLVKLSYAQAGLPKLNGAIHATIVACFPIPKSTSKKQADLMRNGQVWHTKRPDGDNIAKAILDALNGIAFDDDSQVSTIVVIKRYADDPKCIVKMFEKKEV